jgi:hypothetical protein
MEIQNSPGNLLVVVVAVRDAVVAMGNVVVAVGAVIVMQQQGSSSQKNSVLPTCEKKELT